MDLRMWTACGRMQKKILVKKKKKKKKNFREIVPALPCPMMDSCRATTTQQQLLIAHRRYWLPLCADCL